MRTIQDIVEAQNLLGKSGSAEADLDKLIARRKLLAISGSDKLSTLKKILSKSGKDFKKNV